MGLPNIGNQLTPVLPRNSPMTPLDNYSGLYSILVLGGFQIASLLPFSRDTQSFHRLWRRFVLSAGSIRLQNNLKTEQPGQTQVSQH